MQNWPHRVMMGLCMVLFSFFGIVACTPSPSQENPPVENNAEPVNDAGSGDAVPEDKPDKHPISKATNILLIIADDYGVDVSLDYNDANGDGKADDGRSYAKTPTISSICKSGVRFTRAWATPYCSSTRSGILTGRFGFRTGIGSAIARNSGIDTKEWTIPKLLTAQKKDVYTHANIGKWHLGTSDTLKGFLAPLTMGWSHYVGSPSGSLADYSNWTKYTNGTKSTVTNYATTETVDDAIAWLGKQEKSKSWFLWLAFNAPHTPLHLPPKDLHSNGSLSGTQDDIKKNPAPYYRSMVEAMDSEMGRLVTWLKSKGMYENTLIVFLGDNGTPSVAVEPPYNPRRAKGTLFQGGIHVPFCVSGKDVQKGGRTSDALVSSVDLFSTLLEVAGVDVTKTVPSSVTLDSVSFRNVLTDATAKGKRSWNYSGTFQPDKMDERYKTIRDEQYKLLIDKGPNTPAGKYRVQFFDLKKDPQEATNLTPGGKTDNLTADQKTAFEKLQKQLDGLK